MELVETLEIDGEEREIADAYAREQCAANAEGIDGINSNLSEYKDNGYLPKNLFNADNYGHYIYSVTIGSDLTQTSSDRYGVSGMLDGSKDITVSIVTGEVVALLWGIKNNKIAYYNDFSSITSKTYNGGQYDYWVVGFGLKSLGTITSDIMKNNKCMVEYGSSATNYVPYFNSVSDINESLEDYGLKADKPELIQGFYDISNDGIYKEDNLFICNKNAISCESVDKITVITGKECYCRMVFYNENTLVSSEVNSVKNKKNVYVVPENATKANFYFAKDDGNAFNLSELGYCSVYHNNAIDELKNDLSAYADGTKAVAKATTADSATKATQDGNGNDISNTYLRKTDSTNVLLPIGSMIMCNAEEISQYYGTWVDLGTTTITCTTGAGEDIIDVTYTTHVFNRTG